MRLQSADGTAHLTYFDVRTQASFVWNGQARSVQVCIGGYGEAPDHTIPAPAVAVALSAVLRAFRKACRAHAATLDAYPRA